MAWLKRLGPVTRPSLYRSRYGANVGARVAIVVLLAALPAVASAAARPEIVGTARADFLVGRDGSDRVVARAGNDRVAVEYDGGLDRVSCGSGVDVVVADLRDRIDGDCELVSRRIHRDRFSDPDGQHESEVEPDSLTVGATTVAIFQVGRFRAGGATGIGFATSRDGGRSWRQGLLPGITVNSVPPGPAARASDPVVAYDAAHRVWLANTLSIAPGTTRLTIHRSPDGLRWTGPIDAAVAQQAELAYDKNWLVCDNGAASPFRGRCYLAYTLIGGRQGDDLALQRSDDGGRTWSAPATLHLPVTGVIPVVLPTGRLVLVFWSPRTGMVSVTSGDGGVTFDRQVTISPLRARDARPFRAPPLIAADVAGGQVVAVWQDCRFDSECRSNDIVLTRSQDGTTWSEPARVTSGRNAVMPTIGVEPGTGRLAVVYYVIQRNGIDAELVTSTDGATWSAPQRLNARRMPVEWMPRTTLGRMLADYIGVTWARGRPLVVYVLASPPRAGKLRQAVYAARG
jgi:BNR repeat-like domain